MPWRRLLSMRAANDDIPQRNRPAQPICRRFHGAKQASPASSIHSAAGSGTGAGTGGTEGPALSVVSVKMTCWKKSGVGSGPLDGIRGSVVIICWVEKMPGGTRVGIGLLRPPDVAVIKGRNKGVQNCSTGWPGCSMLVPPSTNSSVISGGISLRHTSA